jgi:hypothetical protein
VSPVKFNGHNRVIGENQPGVEPLPVFIDSNAAFLTCWELTDDEIAKLMITRKVWMTQYTGGSGFQPVAMAVNDPRIYE